MKTFDWILITGLLTTIAMAAPAEATAVGPTAQLNGGRDMDIVIATATRSAPYAVAAELENITVLRPGIEMPSKNELLARAREAAREAIENVEISIGKPVENL